MDPNATLRLINEAVEDIDREEAEYLCDCLQWWIDRGGAEPDWSRFRIGHSFYMAYVQRDKGV